MTYHKTAVSPKGTNSQTQQQQGEIAQPRPAKAGSAMSYQQGFTSGPTG